MNRPYRWLPILLLAWVVCGGPSRLATAAPYRFVFWYPGEAGSTAQAQPIMDLVADYLTAHLPGTTWEAKYFASVAGGLRFIREQRPVAGVVSHLMFARHRDTLGLQRLGLARPLPHGRTSESWYLIRPRCEHPLPRTIVHATEPITTATIQGAFAADVVAALAPPIEIAPTGNLLGILKEIAQGRCNYAVLNAREHGTLRQLSTTWNTRLDIVTSATTHPTPCLVLFPGAPATLGTQVAATLRGMASNAQGRALLTELRLAGF